jgi:hypothetical protein
VFTNDPRSDTDDVQLPGRTVADNLTDDQGREVLRIEAVPFEAGDRAAFVFEDAHSPWRQGIWVGTDGVLRVAESVGAQFVLWMDSAPPTVEVSCDRSDGLLRVYNVWDSGRGRGQESQCHTSGMAVEALADGSRRYSCSDIGSPPSFDKLVFRLSVIRPG